MATPYKHILFATDLSPESQEVAAKAEKIAAACQARLSIIHVIEPLPMYAYSYIDTVGMEKQQIDECKSIMADIAHKLNIAKDDQHLKIGPAKAEVIDTADEIKADLIVVGHHPRHGFVSLLGSTANAITHAAHCDVLVIRHKE